LFDGRPGEVRREPPRHDLAQAYEEGLPLAGASGAGRRRRSVTGISLAVAFDWRAHPEKARLPT